MIRMMMGITLGHDSDLLEDLLLNFPPHPYSTLEQFSGKVPQRSGVVNPAVVYDHGWVGVNNYPVAGFEQCPTGARSRAHGLCTENRGRTTGHQLST